MSTKIFSLSVEGDYSMGLEFDAKDEHDNFVLNNITMAMMSLSTKDICFMGDKKKNEELMGVIISITENLFKANNQRRLYIENERKIVNDFHQKSIKDKNKGNLRLKPIELTPYFDNLLSNIKASLDSYVKVFNLFFDTKLHGYHKKKDFNGKQKSGQEVINKLKIKNEELEKYQLENLIKFIEDYKEWISYLVKLRDDFHHYGGLKCVSDITFRKKTKDVLPSLIDHGKEGQEPLGQFLNRVIINFNMFMHNLLMHSLQAKVPFMVLQKTVLQNGSTQYGWGIPKERIIMKKVTIKNQRDQKLSALYHTPKKETDKIVIITHSFKGDKNYQPIMTEFSEHISIKGYAVIRFDCWGSGESEGEFEDSSISTQIDDLKAVIKYTKEQGYKNICLIGLSLGTTDSIMAYDKSIKCMVLWSPVFQHEHLHESYREEVEKNGYIIRKRNLTGEEVKCGKKMWQDFKDIKPYEKLSDIKCPVLSIIGSEDGHITEEKAEEYMSMLHSANELEVIQGGDHDFLVDKARDKAIKLTSDFIKKHL